ncbi:MAG: hypothetical protein VXX55_06525, partial [Planctomycetota bacterium]|nr:hypothetical protein [Planctomycetota bacterium]
YLLQPGICHVALSGKINSSWTSCHVSQKTTWYDVGEPPAEIRHGKTSRPQSYRFQKLANSHSRMTGESAQDLLGRMLSFRKSSPLEDASQMEISD